MKKALLLSTIVAVGGAFAATGAKAQTGSYTFTSASGYTYCDGITGGVVTSAGALSATHNYYACYGTSEYNGLFGGFEGKAKVYGLVDSPYFTEGLELVYYTKFPAGKKCKGGEWVGYYEGTDYGITFSEFNSGGVSCGYDAAKVGGQHKASTRDAALQKAGLLRK